MEEEIDEGGPLLERYQNARKALMSARNGLDRLEYSSAVDSMELSYSLKRDIGDVLSNCFHMESHCRYVKADHQRDLWERKIEQVDEELESVKKRLDQYLLRNQRRMVEAKERSELLDNRELSHKIRLFDEDSRALDSLYDLTRSVRELSAIGENIISSRSKQEEIFERMVERWGTVDEKKISYSGVNVIIIIAIGLLSAFSALVSL